VEVEEGASFSAAWNGWVSEAIMVGTMRFYKRVGVLEFTGTWCQYCTEMARYLKGADARYPDRQVVLAVHVDDALAIGGAQELVTGYKISGLPAAMLDLGAAVVQTDTGVSDMERRLREAAGTGGVDVGLAVETTAQGAVTVRVEGEADVLWVALAQSGVTGHRQKMPDGSWDNGYVHDHVLRAIERVADGRREFAFTVGAGDYSVVVFAERDGRMVNAVECELGKSVDFKYE
jgi:thiol-disulfide isomerase/thioredoxin